MYPVGGSLGSGALGREPGGGGASVVCWWYAPGMFITHARTLAVHASVGAAVLFGLSGCLKRTISITTEPEGALVWLNDVEVGRTPLETDFTYYGTYDVRIRREGYEPLATSAKASAPVYEWPGADLVSEAVPANIHTVVRWHWVLTPRIEATLDKPAAESEVLSRARELRSRSVPPKPEAEPQSQPQPQPQPGATTEPVEQPAPGAQGEPPAPEPQP